jgi:hypothetical protein
MFFNEKIENFNGLSKSTDPLQKAPLAALSDKRFVCSSNSKVTPRFLDLSR